MAIPTRTVTTTQFRPDGSAREGEVVRYSLRRDSYTADGTIPTGDVFAVVGTDGVAEANLWPNAEGLVRSHYTYHLPDGNSGEFVLPEGEGPISLEEIRAAQDTISWTLPTIEDFLELFRAILAGITGSLYIGWIQVGLGAIARTVRDRLRDRFSIFDYIPVAEHAAIRAHTSTYDCSPSIIAAAAAVSEAGGGVLEFPYGGYTLGTQALMVGIQRVTFKAARGTEFLVPETSVARPFVVRDATDIDIEGGTWTSTRSGFTNGICIENSSRVTVWRPRVRGFLSYGMVVSESSDADITAADVSFTAATRTITKLSGGMDVYAAGDTIRMYGSLLNNVVRQVESVTATTIVVTEALVDEAVGATVRIYACAACDDIVITRNLFEDCGIGGINHFPKVRSRGCRIEFNTLLDCNIIDGVPYASTAAIKAGQFTWNTTIKGNHIRGGGSGIALGNWDTAEVTDNQILDINSIGIAISATTHRLWQGSLLGPTFRRLLISRNTFDHTAAFFPATSGAAININGLLTDIGPITIKHNDMLGWRYVAVAIRNSLAKLKNIIIEDNSFRETGGGIVTIQLSATGTANTTTTLTAVNNAGASPAGWAVGSGISGTGASAAAIPANTTVTAIVTTSGSFTMSLPATISDTVTITNVDGTIESTGTLTVDSVTVTNVTNTIGWTIGDGLFGNGIQDGTVLEEVTQASVTFTLSAAVDASGSVSVISDAPDGLVINRNAFVHTPITTTGATHSNTTVDGIPAALWSRLIVGTYVVGTGIPLGTLIAALPVSGTVTLDTAATATATVSIRFAIARRSTIACTNLRFTNNLIDGYGDYTTVLSGGGTVRGNRFINCNPQNLSNRGPIFLGDALAYDILENVYDNGTIGLMTYGCNNTASALVRDSGNRCLQPSIRSMIDPTKFGNMDTQSAAWTEGGKRNWMGTAAPTGTAGVTYYQGEKIYYPAPTAGGYVGLVCTTTGAAGAAGTWKEFGAIVA